VKTPPYIVKVKKKKVPRRVFDSFLDVCIAQYHKYTSACFTLWTRTTSLTFEHTSDQEKLPRNRKENLSQGKKRRSLQESNRGGSLSRMDRTIDVM